MKTILLTKGFFTKVDDEDFESLIKNKWFIANTGTHIYAARRCGPRNIKLHRILINPPNGFYVDHIDGDTLNNQRSNLRVCTKSQNAMNSKHQQSSSSKFKGVSWDSSRGKWRAQIKKHGVRFNLGRFSTEREAASAYNAKAKEIFGEFARLNVC